MHTFYLDKIKSFEGFTPVAKPDYAQHSNGYGTKALFPGEEIDRAEAQRRFTDEISKARQFVERHAGDWDEGTKAALTSLTFNAGTKWASSGLGDAVRAGDAEGVKERFLQYTKAGGEVLPGLAARRLEEMKWIGSAEGSSAGSTEKIDGFNNAAVSTVARLDGARPAATQPSAEVASLRSAPLPTAMPVVSDDGVSAISARISPATAMAVNMLALEMAIERNSTERERNSRQPTATATRSA